MRTLSQPLGAATARAQFETPATVNAPLFRSLTSKLATNRRWVILDLGAVRRQTVELLQRFRCRLDIADLGDDLDTLNAVADAAVRSSRAEALLPAHNTELADIVFCWDYLNYLERGALTSLMHSIAVRCRPGAHVHALIVYRDRRMQSVPGNFGPVDEGYITNRSDSKLERIAPRYSTEDMQACLPDFTIEGARLLGNGMQEYLFRLQ